MIWRTWQWEINQLMHVHLFVEGAKVLTRADNERIQKTVEDALKKLCPTA